MTAVTVNSKRSALSRITVLAGCLLAGTLAVAQAGTAQDTAASLQQVPSMVVSYRDLDLSSTKGVKTLYSRIVFAAHQVCPSESGVQLSQVAAARACREAAIERAVEQVHNAQLAALSAEHVKHG